MQGSERTKLKIQKHSIDELINALMSSDGVLRNEARLELVKMGEFAIDFLAELVNHSNDRVRWEAIKAMGEIKSPLAIPFFIDALEDEISSVRWLAAEGLISLENEGLKAVLESLIELKDSYLLDQSAHHVLYELNKELKDVKIAELNVLLEHSREKFRIPILAKEILDGMRNRN